MLVATTVIEVGVDVPNATMMIIMDADRFGVSQLHQLRGRVGRGSTPSPACSSPRPTRAPSLERLERLAGDPRRLRDVADLDLELRSEGDVLGAEQAGRRRSCTCSRCSGTSTSSPRPATRPATVVGDDPTLARHPGLVGLVRSVVDEASAAFLDRL